MRDKSFKKRQSRVRYKLKKVANGRPRLSVFRSNKHIYVQLIDDQKGITLASASTVEKSSRQKEGANSNIAAAQLVGKAIAEKIKKAGLPKEVIFDRGAYLYHGRVKALADAARENGLVF